LNPAAAHQPIGIFDSGIGGLTVAHAVAKALPGERLLYFGDTAHLPYGDKSADAIRFYCLKIAKFLLDRGCKMIVVACNSASSAGYEVLLEFFREQALFVNVVDPLVEAASCLGLDRVGVIGTKATIHSRVYQSRLAHARPEMKVGALATPLLAPMIEEGFVHNRISSVVLDTYLSDPVLQDIEGLLLACTHYPLIKADIRQWYRRPVHILDSTDVVVDIVRQKLEQRGLLNETSSLEAHRFYVSDYTEAFEKATTLFYGATVHLEEVPIW